MNPTEESQREPLQYREDFARGQRAYREGANYDVFESDGWIDGNTCLEDLRIIPDYGLHICTGWRFQILNLHQTVIFDEDKTTVRPRDIERKIRHELNLPMREYTWDVPATKADPGPKTRGFRDIIGYTIADIRVSAINEVVLTADDGTKFAIESDEFVLGIGIIKCRKLA